MFLMGLKCFYCRQSYHNDLAPLLTHAFVEMQVQTNLLHNWLYENIASLVMYSTYD